MKNILTEICLFFILLFNRCQGLTELIPPDFEEKIWVNAIIIDGSDQNKIIVEKSFQSEYPSEVKGPLEDLSVMINSENGVLFEYFNPKSENRIDTIYLPYGLDFIPGHKYKLKISERNTRTITSETVLPLASADLEVGIGGMTQTFLQYPFECHNPVKSIILNIKFISEAGRFYFIDIKINRDLIYNDTLRRLTNYDILESNSPYFKTFVPGFRSIGFISCFTDGLFIPSESYQACFYDGRTIPDDTCKLKIKIDLKRYYGYYDYKKPVIIYINSIAKDLYTFEKNYHTYHETLFDPFSEPVYLKGNIKGGYGIFAICSNKQYSLILPVD